MRQILMLLILITMNLSAAGTTMNKKMKFKIQVQEEKSLFENLKIQFVSFGHEHSSSGPNEPFSANTGVYDFLLTNGNLTTKTTFYTNVQGESGPSRFWERYEITLLSASSDQKTLEIEVVDLKK